MDNGFCDQCGAALNASDTYCDRCGNRIASRAAAGAPPAVMQAPIQVPVQVVAAPVYQAAQTNGLAIASLVLGILWLYWIGSILAVIFGHVALGQIKRYGQGGRGLAIAGLVLGWVGVGLLIVFVLIGVAIVNSTPY